MTTPNAGRGGLLSWSVGIAMIALFFCLPSAHAQAPAEGLPAAVADPSLRPAIEECFRVQALRDTRDPTLVQVMIQVDKPPTSMGFDVSLRAGTKTIPLGPMAWTTKIGWWAYDADVSTNFGSLDVVFTPSPEAVAKLRRRSSMNEFRLKGMDSIWTGEPIIVRSVKVRSQRLEGMMGVAPPSRAEAVEELGGLLEGDDPSVEQFRRDGDLGAARGRLELFTKDHPDDATAWFNLGCLAAAAGDWRPAVDCFVKARPLEPGPPVSDKAQRGLRRIGGYWKSLAGEGDAEAMCGLGLMYRHGWGPKADPQTAKMWLHKAADAGSAEAGRELEAMRKEDAAAEANRPEAVPPAAPVGNAGPADAAPPATPEQAAEEYRRWIDKHATKSLAGLKLVVTRVEGKERPDTPRFGSGVVTCRFSVAEDGGVRFSSSGDFGAKGGSGSSIGAADLARLDELLKDLPGDGSRLPPAGRRVLLQFSRDGQSIARVYDRADMPDAVLEVLRLSRSGVAAWLPEFIPESVIDARPYQHGGFLTLSPNKSRILFSSANGPIQLWDPVTRDPLGEIALKQWVPMDAIAYNGDASLAAITGLGKCEVAETRNWQRVRALEEPYAEGRRRGLSDPRFTPDGKFLVVACSEPALRVFDTTTWQRVDRLPNIPEDAVRYFPAPKKALAVIQTKDVATTLWDVDGNRAVAALDQGVVVSEVSFSPDESVVAAVTGSDARRIRVRLWKTETGELRHELRPFEQGVCESARFLRWSPDGRYLLAATKSDSFFSSVGISVWNAETGRHRCEFTGCNSTVNGVELLPDGRRLVAGCQDGKIRFWDVAAALKQVGDFEDSLRGDAAAKPK